METKTTNDFFKAVKEHSLLIIIDSASKNDKAVFSLVHWKDGKHETFSRMLNELGFKQYRKEDDLFVTHCAGRFSLYILCNIGGELRNKGVKLPEWYYDEIHYQSVI